MSDREDDEAVAHCVSKVEELAALDEPDRRALLQLGYNLGRLSELTGAGRGPFWDRWKGPVASWDRPALRALALELPRRPRPGGAGSTASLPEPPPETG
ncbi:hypothetical protein [Tautonia plasticadhaerens]|uniref:Uncharacterized protein n=1 Tax=Tautonia plasticadhaerens TaxID=2527974 RepID=A0A518H0C3_9BACT|nr:hypothetical protein [Tautonia plasticadhaerens]QDV34287.1 hypothetical protein ElP_21720 [Tautonia plasticadhaerens]